MKLYSVWSPALEDYSERGRYHATKKEAFSDATNLSSDGVHTATVYVITLTKAPARELMCMLANGEGYAAEQNQMVVFKGGRKVRQKRKLAPLDTGLLGANP